MSRRFGKVLVVPCSGDDDAGGALGREAALIVVEELRPQGCDTICLPRLLPGEPEAVARVRDLPVLAVDGCARRCASRVLEHAGAQPVAALCLADEPWAPAGESDVAQVVAARIATQVDELREELGW
ncbi:MAG: putative zinc-binding protein [Chloroflexota bacterium]